MKIRIFALLFCLCMLVGCLAACADGDETAGTTAESDTQPPVTEAPTETETEAASLTETTTESVTETVSETVSESASETVTETETEIETLTETEIETEIETESTLTINQAEVDRMNAMLSDAYIGNQLPIGGWSPPATDLRDHNTGVEGSYDAAYKLLADAGINFMITLEEWSSPYWSQEALDSAYAAGIDLWYNCSVLDPEAAATRIKELFASESGSALTRIYVKDEPSYEGIPELGEYITALKGHLGDTITLPMHSNLLPTYATPEWYGGDYRNYVRTYLDTTKPSIMMFDYYPFGGTGDTLPAMLANLIIAREEADKDGIPLYAFVQSSAHVSYRDPSIEELRVNAHLNLAMGAKGFAYFLTCEQYEDWGYTPMIDVKGNTTELYDKVKTVNEELNGYKGIFLDYAYKGFIPAEYTALSRVLERQGCADAMLDSFGSLSEIQTQRRGKAVVGCFEDAEGREAYYVVNAEYTRPNTVTLTLDATQSYVIWTKDGATLVENTDTLKLELAAGDAAFVVKFDVNQ